MVKRLVVKDSLLSCAYDAAQHAVVSTLKRMKKKGDAHGAELAARGGRVWRAEAARPRALAAAMHRAPRMEHWRGSRRR